MTDLNSIINSEDIIKMGGLPLNFFHEYRGAYFYTSVSYTDIDDIKSHIQSFIGRKVYKRFISNDSPPQKDFGVIVHAWYNFKTQSIDCYVAFHGPNGLKDTLTNPKSKPYILRCSLESLEILDI